MHFFVEREGHQNPGALKILRTRQGDRGALRPDEKLKTPDKSGSPSIWPRTKKPSGGDRNRILEKNARTTLGSRTRKPLS